MPKLSKESIDRIKPVKSILISQPQPERSPYFQLEEKYSIDVDFRQFIQVEPVMVKDVRKQRIRPDDFSAIIFTSRVSVDHFFRIAEDMRIKMPSDTKYFCLTEAIANYLQKFIVYRKRKVLVGKRVIEDLKPSFIKHRKDNNFLLPCSNLGSRDVQTFLEENEFDFETSMMYKTVSSDLSDLENIFYDILVFFSPLGIESLFENFPNFKQNDTRIAVWGKSTAKAVEERGLIVDINAPTEKVKSMTMALEKYLELVNNN